MLASPAVEQRLQFLRWGGLHGLRCWPRLEDARFFRERIHTLAGFQGRPDSQLQVEHPRQIKFPGLVHLFDGQAHDAFDGGPDLFRLLTQGRCNGTVCRCIGHAHCRTSLHRHRHGFRKSR